MFDCKIAKWLVAPYKKPERDLPHNEKFNNHVSMVRIRSEHTIGFLKGRFQSLKGLRINIKGKRAHKFATYWVAACIGIHAFAMQCEADERSGNDSDADDDFIQEGLSEDESECNNNATASSRPRSTFTSQGGGRLAEGKRRREALKRALFEERGFDL